MTTDVSVAHVVRCRVLHCQHAGGMFVGMSDVTQILSAIEQGDPHAAEKLLPLVYDELRKLAAQRLAGEKSGQTLQATALVHEAYLRLVDVNHAEHWNSRGHFFGAAAEAMRRILVEEARRRHAAKRGGQLDREELAIPTSPFPAILKNCSRSTMCSTIWPARIPSRPTW